MKYKRESRSCNWDKHYAIFHHQILLIDDHLAHGAATGMSKEDKISSFLKTIPKTEKHSELGIAWGIIEGDRSRFPTLIGLVIPHLS